MPDDKKTAGTAMSAMTGGRGIDDNMARLLDWLREQGAAFPAVKIAQGEHGREMRAAGPIRAGTLVLHVPASLMLTVERARESAIGKRIAAHTGHVSDYGYLAAWLLDLRREGGFWTPYLDVLPTDFTGHPAFFGDAEFAALHGSHLLPKLKRCQTRTEFEFHQIRPLLPAGCEDTLEAFAWARTVVATRVHALAFSGIRTSGLMPLADMANHSVRPNLRWQPEAAQGFTYIAARDIEAGEPLTISYGTHPNSYWFSAYGFCIDDNPCNIAEIALPPLPADHPLLEQTRDLGRERDGKRVFQVRADCGHRSMRELLSYLRLRVMSAASEVKVARGDDGEIEIAALAIETEQAALCELALVCQRRLRAFPTSMEEDEALLRGDLLPPALRNAVQVRRDEKSVLRYVRDFVLAVTPMQPSAADAEKYAAYFGRAAALPSAPGDGKPAAATTPGGSGDDALLSLPDWVRRQGASFRSVSIASGKYGRELRAAAPIKDRELILHIPDPLMITPERARETGIGKLMAENADAGKLKNQAFLAVRLLELQRENGHESGFWKPYLDMLPAHMPEHPYYFSDAEMAEFEGCCVAPLLRQRRSAVEYEYRRIQPLLTAETTFTLAEYALVKAIIGSRVHSILHAGKPSIALVPLADMPNHSLEPNMRWRGDTAFGFVCVATRDIEAGEPLTISYGIEGNGHWLGSYGFCLEENPHDETEIVLPELPGDHPLLENAKALGSAREGRRVFTVRANYNHRGTRSMFTYLRLLARNAARDTVAVSPRKDDIGAIEVIPACIENEQAALRELELACRQRLQAFPTTMAEDEALLAQASLPLNRRNAVRMRHGEKAVLHYLLDLALTAMPMRKPADGEGKFDAYFRQLAPLLAAVA